MMFCIVAATIYGFGKTFLWPTMLGVVSERFPRGGAVTLGMMGGIGMLSAGILGGPGIGYEQDYFAVKQLETSDPAAYARYKSDDKVGFLMFPQIAGLDQSKVAVLGDSGAQLKKDVAEFTAKGRSLSEDKNLENLQKWWESAQD